MKHEEKNTQRNFKHFLFKTIQVSFIWFFIFFIILFCHVWQMDTKSLPYGTKRIMPKQNCYYSLQSVSKSFNSPNIYFNLWAFSGPIYYFLIVVLNMINIRCEFIIYEHRLTYMYTFYNQKRGASLKWLVLQRYRVPQFQTASILHQYNGQEREIIMPLSR